MLQSPLDHRTPGRRQPEYSTYNTHQSHSANLNFHAIRHVVRFCVGDNVNHVLSMLSLKVSHLTPVLAYSTLLIVLEKAQKRQGIDDAELNNSKRKRE